MFQLGVKVKDEVTGIEGSLHHLIVFGDGARQYTFQPGKLDPKTGDLVDRIMLSSDRIKGPKEADPELPTELFGSTVTEPISGYTGVVTQIIVHLNGCLHVAVQPPGLNEKNQIRQYREFDIRMLEGEKIKKKTPAERKQSQQERPSPDDGIPKTRMPE